MSPYSTVVVGTDGSSSASRAVEAAAELAVACRARLVVVTAFEASGVDVGERAPEELRWMLTDQGTADEIAAAARREAADLGVERIVLHAVRGEAADQLIEAAETFDADVIVVGSRGLSGAARFVLGSVASSVSHHAPCDVLIAHTDG